MKLLSVIVPIYNVEPFLERCLLSLITQGIRESDYEIICVNDGSPDNSREIIIRIKKEHSNLILLDQENKGVSEARNAGMNLASGKYIMFVDPDDYIMEDSLGKLLEYVNKTGAQVAVAGYIYADSEGNQIGTKVFDSYNNRLLKGIDAYYAMRRKKSLMPDSSVGIFFESAFLKGNGLKYCKGIQMYQDVEFLARMHCLADRCILLKTILYVACERKGSSTRSNKFSTDRVRQGFIRAAGNLKYFQEIQNLDQRQKYFLNGPIIQFVVLSVYSALKTKSLRILIQTIRLLKDAGHRKLMIEGCNMKHKILGTSYNISPFLNAMILIPFMKISRWFNSIHVQT